MDARLTALSEEIPKCRILCDVGCDHGLLSEYALSAGKAEKVALSDLSAASLQKAVRLLAPYGQRVSAYVSDGFNGVDSSCDAALICGIGGKETIHILQNVPDSVSTLILQPMRDVYEVRCRLIEYGFSVQRDYIVESCGKFYDVIKACRGEGSLSEREKRYGKTNLETPGRDFMRYLRRMILKYQKLAEGSLPEPRKRELLFCISEMKEILDEAR